MSAPSAVTFFQSFRQWMADGTFDLDTDTLKCALFTSALTPNAATQSVLADISANEVANGNGYTTGGVTLTSVTWTKSGAVATFDAADCAWTGSGSGFNARYYVLYKAGTANAHANPLIGYGLLDSAGADVQFASGNAITLTWAVTGIFTLS